MRYVASANVQLQLDKLLNRGLTLSDNMDGAFKEILTTGDEQQIQHGLGRIPSGFIVLQIIQAEGFDPIELATGDMQVNKDKDGFLFFLPAASQVDQEVIGVNLWSTSLDKWTKELLFLRANVANLRARLFVL